VAKTKTKAKTETKSLKPSSRQWQLRCDAMLMAWINFNASLHPLGDLENFKEFE